jgi:2-polyprenyl-6-methoxyphenol hydroxylase-like FAD-dependent oxidoreductase
MKIAISGAGVAGPALAYWLLRAGHEPTLIEQAPHLRTGGYMIDFWGVGYTIAERMGILPAVHERGYAIQEVRLLDKRGRKVGGFSTDVFRRMLGNRFVSLPRGDLAAEVYRSIDGRTETILDDSISALQEHGQGVRVVFAKGGERDFDLVVGADGLHSRVRHLTFGPQRQFERHIGYFVAAFDTAGYRPRDELAYVSYAVPGRQVARVALRDDRTMFLLVFAAELIAGPDPRSLDERKASLHRIFDGAGWECPQILEAMDGSEDVYFDRVSQITMDAWSKGRVGLIGDAAACVSLLAGEGTGLALTEAYVLAGELKRSGNDYGQALRRYEHRLRPLIESKQKAARNFAASFAPRSTLGLWVRNQATKLMTIPMVADLLIGGDLRDDLELPEYEM